MDDERPALAELAFQLRTADSVAIVHTASDVAAALEVLQQVELDAVFLDVRMPRFDGLQFARVLGRFAAPPIVVFVSAHDDRAVEAFEIGAVDYLLKPVRPARLAETLRRIVIARSGVTDRATAPGRGDADESIPVELGGRTTMLSRSAVLWVSANGDYARLHTTDGKSHLIRIPMSTLENRWAAAGFVRIHRSYLVAARSVRELRTTTSGYEVMVDGQMLPVSRRYSRQVKELLVSRPRAELAHVPRRGCEPTSA